MRRNLHSAPLLTGLLLLVTCGCRRPEPPRNGSWQHWRGQNYDGSSTATNLPVRWSLRDGVRWSTELPGNGSSTPIVSGDHLFLTAERSKYELLAICVDRRTGKILWTQSLGTGREAMVETPAAPSAVTDGSRVFFLFSEGILAATDFEGNVLWSRELEEDYGRFQVRFGYSASPLLLGDRLFISVIQGDPDNREPSAESPATAGYLLAVDATTGRTIWKQPRPTTAEGESQEAYSSPIPFGRGTTMTILTVGGDCLVANDPETGEERWRWGGCNPSRNPIGRIVPSPVPAAGRVIICAPQYEATYAVVPPPNAAASPSVAWDVPAGPDVTTPLFHDGIVYFIQEDEPAIVAVDVVSGEVLWIEELPGHGAYRASPTYGDGCIYCMNDTGHVVVLKAGRAYQKLAHLKMGGEDCHATIVAVDDQLIIRTSNRLFLVRK